MTEVVDVLPTMHFLVFCRIILLLENFSERATVNLMTASNLAAVFAPVIWRAPDNAQSTAVESSRSNQSNSSLPALVALLRLIIEMGTKTILRDGKRRLDGRLKPPGAARSNALPKLSPASTT